MEFTGLEKFLHQKFPKRILSSDKEFRLKVCSYTSLSITFTNIPSELSWLKIWDMVLDHRV